MKDNVVSSSKGGGNSWEGFKKVPAVSDLKIQSGMKNLLLTRVGLPRKLPSKLEFALNGNAELNRYMVFQINRAKQALEKGDNQLF